MKALKSSVKLLGVLVVLLVLGGVYLFINFANLAKNMTERVASDALGVSVSIGSLDVALRDKTVTVRGVRVGNPRGYKGPYAVDIEEIGLKADKLSDALLSFTDINVTGTEVMLEVTPSGTNLSDIKKHVDAKSAQGDKAAEQIKVIIEHMRIEKMRVIPSLMIAGAPAMDPITVPDLVLNGIGRKENGVLARDAIGQVWRAMSGKISQSASRAGFYQGLDEEALKEVGASQIQSMGGQISHDLGVLGKDLKKIFDE